MPDEFAVSETGQPPAAAPAETTAPKKRNTGLVVALGVLAVLAVLGGIAAALFLFVFQAPTNQVEVRVPDSVAQQPQSGTAATTATAEAAAPAAAVANDAIFTFRDIFKPLISSTTETTTATETTTDTVDTTDYAADTLYLISIGTESGSAVATMVWNSTTYQLGEGDSIPNTPWKVLTIRTSDVIMLYGDQQVVLSVGQGISK